MNPISVNSEILELYNMAIDYLKKFPTLKHIVPFPITTTYDNLEKFVLFSRALLSSNCRIIFQQNISPKHTWTTEIDDLVSLYVNQIKDQFGFQIIFKTDPEPRETAWHLVHKFFRKLQSEQLDFPWTFVLVNESTFVRRGYSVIFGFENVKDATVAKLLMS